MQQYDEDAKSTYLQVSATHVAHLGLSLAELILTSSFLYSDRQVASRNKIKSAFDASLSATTIGTLPQHMVNLSELNQICTPEGKRRRLRFAMVNNTRFLLELFDMHVSG